MDLVQGYCSDESDEEARPAAVKPKPKATGALAALIENARQAQAAVKAATRNPLTSN